MNGASLSSIGDQIRRNWKAGLIVALVNVPLSISLAIAAHATPMMGIVTAIWAGLVAAILGGSHFNIVGPTGALSGLLASYALLFGVESLPILAIISGAMILGIYALKLDRYIIFIPSSVMHGFTLGVAFIIALNQLNFAMGLADLPVHREFLGNVLESLRNAGQADLPAVTVFVLSLATLFLFLKYLPRIPGPIILSLMGIGAGYLSATGRLPFALQTLSTKYGNLELALINPPSFTIPWSTAILKGAIGVAVVAVLETLLSAKIADGMTGTKFRQRREVLGLGFANIASGIFGGIPATAALARTALNIKSNATSRFSSMLNAFFVVAIALLFFGAFRFLPLAVVAAILVYVAIRMVEAEHFKELYRIDTSAFWIAIIVAIITVVEDPIVGILAGAAISLLLFVHQLSKGQSEISMHKGKNFLGRIGHQKLSQFEEHGEVTVYRIAGELTYFNGKFHEETVRRLKGCHTVIFSLRNLYYLDIDGRDILGEIVKEQTEQGRTVLFSGMGEQVASILGGAKWYRELREKGRMFENTRDALAALGC